MSRKDQRSGEQLSAHARLGSRRWTHEWAHVCGLAHDGERVFSITGPGMLYVWDPSTGARLARIMTDETLQEQGSSGAGGLALSPDRKTLAVAGQRISLWSTTSLERLAVFGEYQSGGSAIAFSADGSLLAVAGNSGAELWRVQEQRRLHQLPHERFCDVCDLSFSADGALLATCDGRTLRIWDVETGELLLAQAVQKVRAVVFTGQRRLLVSTCSVSADASKSPPIRCYEVVVSEPLLGGLFGKKSCTLQAAEDGAGFEGSGKCKRLVVSADGDHVAAAIWDGSTHIYALSTGQRTAVLEARFGRNDALAWSPDGSQLLAGGYSSIQGWDPGSGERRWGDAEGHPGGGLALAWSAAGDQLVSSGDVTGLRLWKLSDTTLAHATSYPTVNDYRRHYLTRLRWIRDDQAVAILDIRGVILVDSAAGEAEHWIQSGRTDVLALSMHPGQERLVLATAQQLQIIDLHTRKTIVSVQAPGSVTALSLSDRALFIAANRLYRIDLRSAAKLEVPSPGHCLALEQRGGALLVLQADSTVIRYDATTLERLQTIGDAVTQPHPLSTRSLPRMLIPSMAVSADGRTVAVGTSSVTLYTAAGEKRQVLPVDWDWTQDLAFSADDEQLAGIGSDGTIQIWRRDSPDGQGASTGY